MRDFFIRSLERVINVIMVVGGIFVIIVAAAIGLGGGMMGPDGMDHGGPLAGLLVLIFGGVYLILFGGFIYLGLGIYDNTLRSAAALEKLQMKG